jgi:OmpA-OmpF porin, OOP family
VKGIKIILFILVFSGRLLSQSDSVLLKDATGKTLKRLGRSALKQNNPSSAILFLESYVKTVRHDAEGKFLLGTAYMQIRDYDRAQRMFLNAYKTNKDKAPEALYYHAQMQKSNGLYDSARISFQQFKKEYKGPGKQLKRQASREIAYCDSIKNLLTVSEEIVITHLDTSVNKVNAEGAPVILDDTTMLFTSLRTEKTEYITEEDTSPVIKKKLYLARKRDNVWRFGGAYDALNEESFNNGNACFSADRKRLYFTRCKLNIKQEMICAIYVSERKGEGWTEPVKLPAPINQSKYTSTMPALATDPAKGGDVLYYVSNNKNGKGGLDIWYAVFDKKANQFKVPKNAGNKVNTASDEITPYFDNETRTLYFSSDGLPGLGGFDVFKTRGDGKRWTGAENIGRPVNSGADEIYYYIAPGREHGFFVSNRKGSNSLKNSTCCDDIYAYRQTRFIRIELAGTIADATDDSRISTAQVDIYLVDPKTKEKLFIKTVQSDSTGNFITSLEPEQEYVVVARNSDFLASNQQVSTMGINDSKTLELNLKVLKKPKEPVIIQNLNYDFDRAELTPENQALLDTTLLRLLQDNPEIVVEVNSHTDSKGNDQYNERLSQRRAANIVKYLISKGVEPERIQGTGHGEKMPIAPNTNPDGSDDPEGRHRNRRTDFRIIGTLDTELINKQSIE